MMAETIQLSNLIGTPNEKAIIQEVSKIFSYGYPVQHFAGVHRNYILVKSLFEGNFPGYRACNTEYHNLPHTLDALLAAARLLDGNNISSSPLPEKPALNVLNAALFYNTGYIQEEGDTEGTGAKYTSIHTERSIQFLEENHQAFQISPDDVLPITNIIKCTGPNVRIEEIPFSSSEEMLSGCILGTASLLSQMSDRAYLEKLIFLYYELKEAGIEGYDTEFAILRKTVTFYNKMKNLLIKAYMNTYVDVIYHFKKRFNIDRNLYMEAIDSQITYLHKIIEDDTTNFRHKLKRGDWIRADAQPQP